MALKFACIMVTRGNPERAAAVIDGAKALTSGRHDIQFIVCADTDDKTTQDYFRGKVDLSIAESPTCLGSIWNRGAALANSADVICPFPDDTFVGCPDWDEVIAQTFAQLPPHMGVIAWNEAANPGLCTLPIVTKAWYEIAGLYPEHFPYWFYDTWVAEVYSFVTGYAPAIPQKLILASKKGKTQRMRDLSFWWDFYSRTREDRLVEAARIRARFNLPIEPEALEFMVARWRLRDANLRALIPSMEASNTDSSAQLPSEKYLMAKHAAEAHLSVKDKAA